MSDTIINHNKAKMWQMALFVFNNTATNVFMFYMGYISYYAVGVAGLAVVAVSFILTGMRIFDGITDPIIGFVIDKTNTKFGKFRPMMLLGYIIMVIVLSILINTVYRVPENIRFLYFSIMYSLYIIGYTFQTACTKAGQACLTSCPKQRPTFSLYDGIYNTALFSLVPLFVFNYLVPKHTVGQLNGLNNLAFHKELLLFAIIASGILTVLAMIGIAKKDKKEFFGLGEETTQVHFRDYLDVLKNNKAIQMLIFAASTDKLANSTMGNAAVIIIIFSITSGNPALVGTIPAITVFPSLVVLAIGVAFARRFGQKRSLVGSTWVCLILSIITALFILFGPMNTLSISNLNVFTILFICIYILLRGFMNIANSIVIPMIPDCADYETYRSGRYIPGMMGTLFSLVDKLVSSFATTIVGLTLAFVGFRDKLPTQDTEFTRSLLYAGVFLFIGMPLFGFICSLIAMKFYPLTKDKMEEIQEKIQEIKQAAAKQSSTTK